MPLLGEEETAFKISPGLVQIKSSLDVQLYQLALEQILMNIKSMSWWGESPDEVLCSS